MLKYDENAVDRTVMKGTSRCFELRPRTETKAEMNARIEMESFKGEVRIEKKREFRPLGPII